jgi:prepilin-type N-terminal cleavage/methylation domain-containing protein
MLELFDDFSVKVFWRKVRVQTNKKIPGGKVRKKMNRKISRQSGFNLIELMIVIAIIGLLISVGSIGWKAMIESGNETSAMQTLDLIRKQQVQYAAKKNGNFGSFEELVTAVDFDDKFKAPEPVVNGYKFTMKVTPKSASQPAFYEISAEPQQKGGLQSTGSKCFYISSSLATLRADEKCPATADSPALGQ